MAWVGDLGMDKRLLSSEMLSPRDEALRQSRMPSTRSVALWEVDGTEQPPDSFTLRPSPISLVPGSGEW